MKISIAIALIVIGFLTLPLSLIPIIAVVLYLYRFKNRNFAYIIHRLEGINGRKLFIACGLTVASTIIVYQHTAYATQLGFPSPFITDYGYPATPGVTVIAGPLWSRLAVDPFAALVDVALYYLLLSLTQWVYRRGAL